MRFRASRLHGREVRRGGRQRRPGAGVPPVWHQNRRAEPRRDQAGSAVRRAEAERVRVVLCFVQRCKVRMQCVNRFERDIAVVKDERDKMHQNVLKIQPQKFLSER